MARLVSAAPEEIVNDLASTSNFQNGAKWLTRIHRPRWISYAWRARSRWIEERRGNNSCNFRWCGAWFQHDECDTFFTMKPAGRAACVKPFLHKPLGPSLEDFNAFPCVKKWLASGAFETQSRKFHYSHMRKIFT